MVCCVAMPGPAGTWQSGLRLVLGIDQKNSCSPRRFESVYIHANQTEHRLLSRNLADGSSFGKVIPALQADGQHVLTAQYGLDTPKAMSPGSSTSLCLPPTSAKLRRGGAVPGHRRVQICRNGRRARLGDFRREQTESSRKRERSQ